jgi:hypothetical protein
MISSLKIVELAIVRDLTILQGSGNLGKSRMQLNRHHRDARPPGKPGVEVPILRESDNGADAY